MKKVLALILVLIMIVGCTVAAEEKAAGFSDVPAGNFFEEYINKLKELNITNGVGNGAFGFNQSITRAEFLTFLIRLLELQPVADSGEKVFQDVSPENWYYPYISLGLHEGIIFSSEYMQGKFEPNKHISREEMAMMIVRALKYDALAKNVNQQPTQFKDVKQNVGYIEIARDLGIINGRSQDTFAPEAKAYRQEAAAMLVRMFNIRNNKLEMFHGFYAIKSFGQVNKTSAFDSVGYGWSRLDYNDATGLIELTTTKKTGGQPFYIPEDFQLAVAEADNNTVAKYIAVFASNQDTVNVNGIDQGLVSLLLANEEAKQKLIQDIVNVTNQLTGSGGSAQFDGVIIDFEGLKNIENTRQSFTDFLVELKNQLALKEKKLMVCINPPREAGQPYFDGYDFAGIGKAADFVILMAHDYEPKRIGPSEMQSFKGETPLAPIKSVYYALKYVLDNDKGIPKEKLLLQMSFSAAQWQFSNETVLNSAPYNPDYAKIYNRMVDPMTTVKSLNYSDLYEAPYMTFESEGIKNIVWYEDARSVEAKADLARDFGIKGISFWRMGLIPDFPNSDLNNYQLNLWDTIERLDD